MSSRLIKFTNNARSTLNGGIAAGATAAAVQSGHGTRFPSITGSEYFYATLDDGSGVTEIIKVTARTGDSFGTIARAQEGTTAVAWADGSLIQLRLTEDGMQQFVGQGVELVTRTDLPTNSTADTGIAYAVGNDRRVTLDGSGDTSQDLFHMDENGLVLRPGDGFAALDGTTAHDWSALAAPEIPRTVVITPTATRIVTLPTLKVPIGWSLEIINLSTDQLLTIAGSAGATIRQVFPGQRVTFVARTKTPTTGAHWWSSIGTFHRDVTPVVHSGTAGVLMEYTIPANVLNADGKRLRFTCWGTKTGNNSTAGIQIRFAGAISETFDIQGDADAFRTTIEYIRTGANTQHIFVQAINSNSSEDGFHGAQTQVEGSAVVSHRADTEDTTGTITFDLNVSGMHANDVVTQQSLVVELLD